MAIGLGHPSEHPLVDVDQLDPSIGVRNMSQPPLTPLLLVIHRGPMKWGDGIEIK